MLRFVLGVVAAFAVMGLGGLAVVQTGAFDIRASTPHGPIISWAAHATMIHATQHRAAGVHAPTGFSAAQVEAGFREYDVDCVACHGGPAVSRAAWVSGINPSPPYLLDAPRHWSAAELYLIVGDGVKMTAMPAWKISRSDADIWNLVAFLEALPYITPQSYAQMRAVARGQAASTPGRAAADGAEPPSDIGVSPGDLVE
jgi:mono/diheme cytochrome c family protein